VGFKGRGDDDVLPGGQAEALGYLAQVDVGLAFGLGRSVEEEVFPQMLLATTHLRIDGAIERKSYALYYLYYECITSPFFV